MKGSNYTVKNGHPQHRQDNIPVYTNWYRCFIHTQLLDLPFIPYPGLHILDEEGEDYCVTRVFWDAIETCFYLDVREVKE